MTEILLRIMRTLESIPLSGADNWDKMLGVIKTLKELIRLLEEKNNDDHQDEQKPGV